MVATVMVKDCDLQSESATAKGATTKGATANCNSILVSPRRERSESQPDLLSLTQPSTQIRLALEELNCFEIVEHQFQHWGITFINAITLQPSNPVFGIDPEAVVLMGAPKSGWLEIYFATPIRRIEAEVISSRLTVLSAYNSTGEEIAQTEMTVVKSKSRTHPMELPKAQLSLTCAGISKITFYAFDGQLVISQLLFEF